MTAVGVDWASGCWVVVAVDGDDVTMTTEPAMLNVWHEHGRGADAVLVDIPIGLPETPGRACDEAAGARLGNRHGSVFDVPCRAAVEADDYAAASDANGGSLGSQSWWFVPQIREVDCFLDAYPAAEERVYESHPEVCYAAFGDRTGHTPLGSKDTADGVDGRLSVLEAVHGPLGEAVRSLVAARRDGAAWHRRIGKGRIDDVVDAAVLAATADGELDALPDDREVTDRQVIVYPA
jgi:predicted RNase H-like nuclease